MLKRPGSSLRRRFWSLLGRTWDEQAATSPHVGHVVEILRDHARQGEGRVLDLGCGTGACAVALARAGFDVTGVDSAPGMLARAYPKVSPDLASRLRFRQADADGRLPFPEQHFDVVIAISVLQTLQSPQRTSREVWWVLKPGGLFVVFHFPAPAYQGLPIVKAIRRRIAVLGRRTITNVLLVTLKMLGERAGGTRYWTAAQLGELFSEQGFDVETITGTNPMVAVARKSSCAPGAGSCPN
jgi:ubiquinone/menaquinone biosynthesis C-methylase UbiE